MTKVKNVDSITTFLGHDATIDGTIEFKGVIRVDGEVTGKVQSEDGTIIVGEKAVINGDIAIGNAIITGEVNGNITAKEKVEIFAPGRVMGDIQAALISIDPGSFFNGKCVMTSRITPQKKSEISQDASSPDTDPEGKEKKSKKL